jgi:hypothetical protein
VHIPSLPAALDDIDSVNFALALRDYDIAAHQPHPPGYPLFVAMGRLSLLALGATAGPGALPGAAEARALAVWGILLGALAAFPLLQLFRMIEHDDRRALAAAALTMAAPLFWFTAARPMSDVAGLALALVPIALLVTAYRRQQASAARSREASDGATVIPGVAESGRLLVGAAFLAGLLIGFRSQTAWLTLPLLALVLLHRTGRGAAGALLGTAMTFAIGVLLWAIPLVVATGGVTGYLNAVGTQAGEDFAGVDLLVTNPSARRLAAGLLDTFVQPWASLPLAVIVGALALAGAAVMLFRSPGGLLLLAAVAGPYAIFHTLFQETATTRYALPLLPAVAYLAIRGLDAATRQLMPAGALALVATCLVLAVPAADAYADSGGPLFRAVADVERLAGSTSVRPVLAMHHAFARAVRGRQLTLETLPSPPRHEWLELVRHWRDRDGGTLWYLTDPKRTDLALIDPSARSPRRLYEWPFDADQFLKGARPAHVLWSEIEPPGWILAEGWSLTPETAGLATLDRRTLAHGPIAAYVRSRAGGARLLVGGRHLGERGQPDARVTVSAEGRELASWTASPEPAFFLRLLELPPGALVSNARYLRLEISSAAAAAGPAPPVAIEQFDLQPPDRVMYGFDRGWHEREYNPGTGRLWRWASDHAETRVHNAGRDLTLRLTGESPLRYFDAPPEVVVRAGSEVLARAAPSSDFDLTVRVPADALERSAGVIALDTSRIFVPAEAGGSPDRRRLGLRIYSFELK